MIFVNLTDIVTLNIKDSDCCCIISRISKTEAIKLLQNIDMTEDSGKLKTKHQ